MAKNDQLLIDGIIDDRVQEHLPSDQRDEAFEFFACEQILRDVDLSHDEINSGLVDGRDDGGIDGFYILINGHLLTDPQTFLWPKSGAELSVTIVTCKHHDTFRQSVLDKLVASFAELFDLATEDQDLKGAYSETILQMRGFLRLAYRKLSPRLKKFRFTTTYASRGKTAEIGDAIKARAEQLNATIDGLFGDSESSFQFIGAKELLELHRKVRLFTLELPFLELLSRGERYVLLARLDDYWQFVVDENSTLRRYLFDSNVRDFMGLNRVNEDIQNSLEKLTEPDFWLLNNGITILATAASVTGKSIKLEGVQIVNGLQTTESIARFFNGGGTDPTQRAVLVKIVVLEDPAVRDEIIRATNNQTVVEIASLHATDKVQRDIEDAISRVGLAYERRKNFYVNQGVPASDIITPLYVAAAYVNLVLKSPKRASTLKSRFMRSTELYSYIFSESATLGVWPALARIHKKVDSVLEKSRGQVKANARFLKSWRYLTAFVAVARIHGKFSYSDRDLAVMDLGVLTEEIIQEAWTLINSEVASSQSRNALKISFVERVCTAAAAKYGLKDVKVIESKLKGVSFVRKKTQKPIDNLFLDRVDAELPSQPWKPGVHRDVAKKLCCNAARVSEAINLLIDVGRRNNQVDGVVYDEDGGILAVDPERLNNSGTED